MSSTAATTSLAHRTVTNIRTAQGYGSSGPPSPHTPTRTITSAFGSPSSLRAEEDLVLIELGSRFVRVGFAGDSCPKAQLQLRPSEQRRVGDHRVWHVGYEDDWMKRPAGKDWGRDHEIWQYDLRSVDLGVVEDKLDRLLRDAFSRYLLIDSRPRRMALILPSTLPLPLLSTTLDLLFNRFQPPMVSLLSSPVMAAVAAGVRSSLVVDLGWSETVVTSVYEFREVRCTRSVRGGRHLIEELHKTITECLARAGPVPHAEGEDQDQHTLSFDECEEIASRVLWCSPPSDRIPTAQDPGLATVQEHDESEADGHHTARGDGIIQIPLKSTRPPTSLSIAFSQLAGVCDNTYFDQQYASASFDDDELPVHLLIYQHMLRLPVDVRSICMSRIIFTGGCSRILGLKSRIFDEVSAIVSRRGWDPVSGKGAEQCKRNLKSRRNGTKQAGSGPVAVAHPGDGGELDDVWHDAANAFPEGDPIEAALHKHRAVAVQGQLRAIESLGAWSGASLACQLKTMAIANVEREPWLQHGIAGACRPADVDVKAQHRQSMGAGGLMRGTGSTQEKAWTLGPWGAL